MLLLLPSRNLKFQIGNSGPESFESCLNLLRDSRTSLNLSKERVGSTMQRIARSNFIAQRTS